MPAPRLQIDLEKIAHNARTLVKRLALRGIAITGVTKAILGAPEVAAVMLRAGIDTLGDSRVENLETMRRAGITTPLILIRTPMLSQVDRVVRIAGISFNTELDVISALSTAARKAKRNHGIVLMVELGDLREGILPKDLESAVRQTLRFPNISLRGIGANLACRSGVSPDTEKMSELSSLASILDTAGAPSQATVSGGNSASLDWAFGAGAIGRINNLRLGEAILLGREPLRRQRIDGLHCDAFTLAAEVIEAKVKPTMPWGQIAQSAFGAVQRPTDRGNILQAIVAIGRQDIDPDGLRSLDGFDVIGASSDHLIVDTGGRPIRPGAEMHFQLNYAALLRAMTSPFVAKVYRNEIVPAAADRALPAVI